MTSQLKKIILGIEPMVSSLMHWRTFDPFLFCAHHHDAFPASISSGEDHASLGMDPKHFRGRNIGSDFSEKDGFSMYHGESVPGFPSHPHFGFETVTIAERGLVDHSDSFGQTARYGNGDVQWMTAGSGIQHAEMFPLLNSDKPNPMELFQLWLNLPEKSKTVPPHFTIAWEEQQPRWQTETGDATVRLIGGKFMGMDSVAPPPNSYASDSNSHLVIARITMKPHSTVTLPALVTDSTVHRTLYLYSGANLTVAGQSVKTTAMIRLVAQAEATLQAGDTHCELLLLQGKPLNEPVVQHGPFVTSSRKQLEQVFEQFHRTRFGGWDWGRSDPVHVRSQGRFYKMKGGKKVAPPAKPTVAKSSTPSEEL